MKLAQALAAASDTPRLVAYLTLGDPDAATTLDAARAVLRAGGCALELGIPTAGAPENEVLTRSHARAVASTPADAALAVLARVAREAGDSAIIAVGYWPALRSAW